MSNEYCEVRSSSIHGRGVFATRDIPASIRIVEYLGERVSKEEGAARGERQLERARESDEPAVLIIDLSDEWDLDGRVPNNLAAILNHSCDPNCTMWNEENRIWIYSARDIERGEELTFDYGFDIADYKDYPCRCGAKKCIGYMVSREYWPALWVQIAIDRAKKEKG